MDEGKFEGKGYGMPVVGRQGGIAGERVKQDDEGSPREALEKRRCHESVSTTVRVDTIPAVGMCSSRLGVDGGGCCREICVE